jgi:hypothetical protein
MVLDGRVLAANEAGLVETLTERIGTARYERPSLDEADDRQRTLLRTRGERPGRGAPRRVMNSRRN